MRPEAGHSMMARRSSAPGRATPTKRRASPGRPRGRPQCKRRTRMQRDRTSKPESRATAPSPNRPTCNGGRHRLCRSRYERKCRAQTRDEAGKEVPGAPSCGRSQTVLYNACIRTALCAINHRESSSPHNQTGRLCPAFRGQQQLVAERSASDAQGPHRGRQRDLQQGSHDR